MDKAQGLLEKFEASSKRHVIFMNSVSTDFYDEYIAFNIDVLRELLPSSCLDFELLSDGALISRFGMSARELFEKLLFDGAIFADIRKSSGGVFLSAAIPVCEMMSAVCRILEIFGK